MEDDFLEEPGEKVYKKPEENLLEEIKKQVEKLGASNFKGRKKHEWEAKQIRKRGGIVTLSANDLTFI